MLRKVFQFIYFMYFVLLFALLIVFSIPFTLLFLLFPKRICDIAMFRLMKFGANTLFIMSGIIPKNYHRERTDFSKSYIIIPNHQSYIDAASIYTSIPIVFKTLGKKEIEKVPIYGIIFKAVCITVDRSSLSARALSFRKMKTELENGLSIAIFPEGTFADIPQTELLPFQDGSFTLSIMQQADLLPILYLDASNRMHPSRFTEMSIGLSRAVFLPKIAVSNLEKKDVEKLKQYTQKYMQSCHNFILENNAKEVWDFALNYQKNNVLSNI